MPIYVYQVIEADGSKDNIFEIEQSMHDEPLKEHPKNKKNVVRVYQPPNLSCKHGAKTAKNKLDPKQTEKAGFTRYERDKISGKYFKVSGKDKRAPNVLNPKQL